MKMREGPQPITAKEAYEIKSVCVPPFD